MNSQRTVILAVGAAALMVMCAVVGCFVFNDQSTNTANDAKINENGTYVAETDTIGESGVIVIVTEPEHDYGTSELQTLLAQNCKDKSTPLIPYLVENVKYNGEEITYANVCGILNKVGFHIVSNNCMLVDNGLTMDLSSMTVEDFLHIKYNDSPGSIHIYVPHFRMA